MSKVSDNVTRIESWLIRPDRDKTKSKVGVSKIATRNSLGQFHGATNFRGTVNPR